MTSRLFCRHCEKHYEVDTKDIKLMQRVHSENLTFSNNTYYFENSGCFFKAMNHIKRDSSYQEIKS